MTEKTKEVQTWEQTIASKHRKQMEAHERRFGPLGKLQTDKQKRALARSLEGRGN